MERHSRPWRCITRRLRERKWHACYDCSPSELPFASACTRRRRGRRPSSAGGRYRRGGHHASARRQAGLHGRLRPEPQGHRRPRSAHGPRRRPQARQAKDRPRLASISSASFMPSVERVRKQLTGFTYVLVSSTHNHEGPDTLGLWGPKPFTSGVDARLHEDGRREDRRGGARPPTARGKPVTAPHRHGDGPGAAARRPRAVRQARRAGRPGFRDADDKLGRRRRAVELPPRDARIARTRRSAPISSATRSSICARSTAARSSI